MTNYTRFPSWRRYGIVIKYNESNYSWSDNTPTQRKYLLESAYCDNAVEFFVWENNTTYKSILEFKHYLSEKLKQGNVEICPLCGGKLIIKINRNDHNPFYGCSNYPECIFTKNA